MDVNMKELGRRVREAREAAGVSQNDAAKTIEVSQPTYYRIESGNRPLKGDELIQLADFFGIRAATITGLADVGGRVRFAARSGGGPPMRPFQRRWNSGGRSGGRRQGDKVSTVDIDASVGSHSSSRGGQGADGAAERERRYGDRGHPGGARCEQDPRQCRCKA